VVKLRPVIPHDLPKGLRQLAGFVVEVDAMPGGYMCSASLKGVARAPGVKETVAGGRPIRKLFTKDQRRFFAEHADGIELDDLSVLGPHHRHEAQVLPTGLRPPSRRSQRRASAPRVADAASRTTPQPVSAASPTLSDQTQQATPTPPSGG
jgi:hypothetical protein